MKEEMTVVYVQCEQCDGTGVAGIGDFDDGDKVVTQTRCEACGGEGAEPVGLTPGEFREWLYEHRGARELVDLRRKREAAANAT